MVGAIWLALSIRAGGVQWKRREFGSRAPPDARLTGIDLLKDLHHVPGPLSHP